MLKLFYCRLCPDWRVKKKKSKEQIYQKNIFSIENYEIVSAIVCDMLKT